MEQFDCGRDTKNLMKSSNNLFWLSINKDEKIDGRKLAEKVYLELEKKYRDHKIYLRENIFKEKLILKLFSLSIC